MKVCGSCGAWIPDDARSCPSCGTAPAGEAPPAGPGPGAGPAPGPVPGAPQGPVFDRGATEKRIRTIGTLFAVMGVLTVLMVLWNFIQAATGQTLRSIEELEKGPKLLPPEVVDTLKTLYQEPLYLAVSHAVPFALGAFWAWSGWRLRALQGRNAGIAASITLIALSPCSPCCCLSIPLGVFGLVVLGRGDAALAMKGAARR